MMARLAGSSRAVKMYVDLEYILEIDLPRFADDVDGYGRKGKGRNKNS